MTTIKKLLQRKPLMSSALAQKLAKAESIPINTASQRIARTKSINKIKGFFVSNQSLCYLDIHTKDEVLFDSLLECLFEYGRKYWYCLNAILLHDGIVSQNFLECYTNYPILPLAKHIPFDKVMQKFVAQKILIFNGGDYLISPKLKKLDTNIVAHRTIEIIKDDTLASFKSLTQNIGLISYNSGQLFGEYGKFRWAFKGVSAITGLMQNNKFGFVLADIIIGKPILEKDISFFVEKIKHVQSFKNPARIIPFLIVDDLEKKALNTLKKHGVAIGFIGELFGQKYAETLKELVSILNNIGASLKKTPDKYLKLIKQLRKYNEGLLNNIRGTLFEYMVGHIHSLNCQSIDTGREIVDSNGRHEMDILAIYSDKVVIAECKAKRSEINLEIIDKWIDEKIPAFKEWFLKQETFKKKKLVFEFWSTSAFRPDAFSRLKRFSKSASKFEVNYLLAEDIRKIALEMNNKKLKEALDNFFLKTEV